MTKALSTDVQGFLGRFLQTKVGQAAFAEDEQATLSDRRKLVSRLADIDLASATRAEKNQRSRSRAETEYFTAKSQFEKAANTLAELIRHQHAVSWCEARERDDLEHALEVSAPAEIETLIAEIDDRIASAQRNVSGIPLGSQSTLVGRPDLLTATNARSTTAFLEIARAIHSEARALRLVAQDHPEMLTKVAALRARLGEAAARIAIEEVALQPPQFIVEAPK